MSKVLDNIAKLSPIFNVKEPRFGARGDNSTNDTAALQAAINAAQAVGGCVEIPWGTYLHDGLTISGNVTIRGWEQTNSRLVLRAGTNANSITVNLTTQNPIIETLTIDGNRANNLSSGHGINLPDNPETNPSVNYGFSVVLRNVYVQNTRGNCLNVGVNRNMGHVENSEFKRGAKSVVMNSSSDWRFVHARIAFPQTSHALEVVSGADNVFMGCSIFGATLAACVKLDSPGSSPTKLIGCTINFNQLDGIWIKGFTGAARTIGHQIIGCWFEGNGLAADNTYSDIVLDDTRDAVLMGNTFRWTGSGNRPQYLVRFDGAASSCQWVGNTYDDSVNVPFATAISDEPTRLHMRAQALYSDAACFLGGAGDAYSLNVQQGVAGGNFVRVQGRAAGVPPDITVEGVDSSIALRVSTKGLQPIDFRPSGTRIVRIMATASAVNYLDLYGSATGNPVRINANGTDADIDVSIEPRGAGNLVVPIANVPTFTNDAGAAAGGVPVGGVYRNGSALQIRVS